METSRYRKLCSNGLRGTNIQILGSEVGTMWKMKSWRGGGYNRSAKQEMVVAVWRGRGAMG